MRKLMPLLLIAAVGCDSDMPTDQGSRPADDVAASAKVWVDDDRLVNADSDTSNWLSHGRTYDEQRFSPLDQVNSETIDELALAWSFDTDTYRGLEATPIVVDGIMFTTTTWSVVNAHDAKTGALLWQHDPEVPREWGFNACCDVVNRGVAVWEDKVFLGTLDGRLVALDAQTGQVVWEILTIDPSRPYTITGAPRVVNGKVVIGNGGAEYGVRGYVTAYDGQNGEELWRFYTVPGDPNQPFEHPEMEAAAKTWLGGEWWKVGGGGTAWDAFAYDPELNLLYVGTGNGSPWSRYTRSPGGGDNLYLASVLALNPDTGRLVWHYQTTPGDNLDYTAVQQITLADIEIDGTVRQVLMQAPKNGFFYVLDRKTGELISAEPYVAMNWASHVDPETGRPVENAESHYLEEMKYVFPGPDGGHNWHPMSYSPETGLVYIPVIENGMIYAQETDFQYDPEAQNMGLDFNPVFDDGEERVNNTKLVAWDPVAGTARWAIDHNRVGASGVLATAGGLVFQPGSDCSFKAYDAGNGDVLWETSVQMSTIAGPISYEVDGEQYIAFMSGWGGAAGIFSWQPCTDGKRAATGRILAYKLGGTAELPPAETPDPVPMPPPKLSSSPDDLQTGRRLFLKFCWNCHALGKEVSGILPNLVHATTSTHDAWDAIVLGGSRRDKGMISFSHVLSTAESRAIQSFVIERAHQAYEE
jgi:PQQ-dependent dehydrogenase (methanol/ethanol family)